MRGLSRSHYLWVMLGAFGWLALCGCDSDTQPDSGLATTTVQIDGHPFTVEIAVTFHDQEVGLMHRDSLDPDHGMIFVNDAPSVQHFWNHDVHFALDNLFLGPDGTIVSIKHMDAYSEKDTSSDVPAKYIIELLGGTVDKDEIKVGDHISLPDVVIHPPSASPATAPSATTTSAG